MVRQSQIGGFSRRRFLQASAGVAAGLAWPAAARPTRPESVRLAILGLNGRGNELAAALRGLPEAQLVAIADPDQRILDKRRSELAAKGIEVDAVQDLRRLLDRDDIHAVAVATPNFWHALAAVWACQAGKDVYVEKPVSHSIWEGRQIVRAAERYARVAQAGLQNRSDSGLRAFKRWFDEGHLGRPRYVHTVWYRVRNPIGRVAGPTPIPPEVDFDLYCGPREVAPLLRQNLHYDWHWQFQYGAGEMGNLGVHVLDESRWLLDLAMPRRVLNVGARLLWDDDGDTPNVSFTVAEFDQLPMICEVRDLPAQSGSNAAWKLRGRSMVSLIVCEHGYFMGGRGGGAAFSPSGEEIRKFPGDSGATHMANFVEVVRSRDTSTLRTPIEEGHRSTSVAHIANIGYRLGRQAPLAEIHDSLSAISPAAEAFESIAPHLQANGLDPANTLLRTSGWMTWDPAAERFTEHESLPQANAMLRLAYREPFVLREEV